MLKPLVGKVGKMEEVGEKIVRHWGKIPLKHRVTGTVLVCVGGFVLWRVTQYEGWLRVAELGSAPLVHELILGGE